MRTAREDVVALSPHTGLRRLGLWSLRGLPALLDQGFLSFGSFVVNVLLARWLDRDAYGAFAVAYSVLWFLAGFHNALVLEPMSVLGPANHSGRLRSYFAGQTKIHFAVTMPLAVALLVIGEGLLWLSPANPLGGALLGGGAALPFVLLLWTARRYFYILERPVAAAIGSAAYFVLGAGGVVMLHLTGTDAALFAFVVIGLASLLPSIVLLSFVRARHDSAERAPAFPELMREQWEFGRWQAVAGILVTLGCQAQMYLAAGYLGLESAAALRAMEMGMLPMTQVVMAIVTLQLPVLARDFGRGDLKAVRRKALVVTGCLTVAACAYEGILIAASGMLERLFFHGKYVDKAWLMPLMGIIPVLTALTAGSSLILRAAQKPRHHLIQAAIVAPVGLVSTAFMIPLWGLGGAAVSLVLTYAVSAVLLHVLCRLWVPERKTKETPSPGAVEGRAS